MHFKVIACDLDGTLTDEQKLAPETWEVLHKARAAGFSLVLVTGRVLETFQSYGPFDDLFDAIVCENGAVTYFPKNRSTEVPFGSLSSDLIQRLKGLDLPLEFGVAIAATHKPHDRAVMEVLRDMGGAATVEYNRHAVMILPPGATKGTGLKHALDRIGHSLHNVVACGDAENDRSLFEVSELAVAVTNASPTIQRAADTVLTQANGAGVRSLIEELIRGEIPQRRLRPHRRLCFGSKEGEGSVCVDPFILLNKNLGIIGGSGSGKSWAGGLLAEELLKQDYQVLLIDPEGDYRGSRSRVSVLAMEKES